MLFVAEMIYDKDLHVKTLVHDKVTRTTEETVHHYDNNKRTKMVTYSFLGDAKFIKETTFYENSEHKELDFVSIDARGDTIAIKKTLVKDDGRVVFSYYKEFGIQYIWYYDKAGQLVATATVDINAKERRVVKYSYDVRGNRIEEITYTERVDNMR